MDKIIVCFITCLLLVQTGCAQMQPEQNEVTSFEECAAAGNPVTRSLPPQCMADGKVFKDMNSVPKVKAPAKKKSFCKDTCGNGSCEEMVCMAVGCPCAESAETCPEDCAN